MPFVAGFVGTLAVVDVHLSVATDAAELQIADALALPFGKRLFAVGLHLDGLDGRCGQMVVRRTLLWLRKGQTAVSLRPGVGLRGHGIVGHRPGGVAQYGRAFQPEGGRRDLVVDGNVQRVFPPWHREPLGHAKQVAVAVNLDAILSFGLDFHFLGLGQFHGFLVFHRLLVAVGPPEGGIE